MKRIRTVLACDQRPLSRARRLPDGTVTLNISPSFPLLSPASIYALPLPRGPQVEVAGTETPKRSVPGFRCIRFDAGRHTPAPTPELTPYFGFAKTKVELSGRHTPAPTPELPPIFGFAKTKWSSTWSDDVPALDGRRGAPIRTFPASSAFPFAL